MNSQFPTQLKWALYGNAGFSLLTGIALILFADPLATWTGINDPRSLTITGLVLLPFAGHLIWAANRKQPIKAEILYFCLADAGWVLGSALLLVFQPLALTVAGFWTVTIVALCVADFMGMQWWGLRQAA